MSHSPPEIPGRLWAIAAITGSSAFMATLDSTITNLAIETIGADFGAPLPDVQWVATGYLIALAISLPLTAGLDEGSETAAFGLAASWPLLPPL